AGAVPAPPRSEWPGRSFDEATGAYLFHGLGDELRLDFHLGHDLVLQLHQLTTDAGQVLPAGSHYGDAVRLQPLASLALGLGGHLAGLPNHLRPGLYHRLAMLR